MHLHSRGICILQLLNILSYKILPSHFLFRHVFTYYFAYWFIAASKITKKERRGQFKKKNHFIEIVLLAPDLLHD